MKKRKWQLGFSLMAILFLMALAGCSGSTASSDSEKNGKMKVVATTGMIADMVANIGGEYVEADGLMGPGVDPHLYKATQGDVKKLEGADIIFYNGLHLEGKMNDIFEKMSSEKPTIAITKNIDKSDLLKITKNEYDPHVWFDVQHWMAAAETVTETLVKNDPEHKEAYEKNSEIYLEQLEELDRYVLQQIGSIPENQRVLVTAHDAFGYFGKAYDIEVKGLQGISTLSEYGSKDVSELRDYLVENKIKAVFIESSVSKKALEAVIQGAEKKGHIVKIGGELYSDAMGAEGTEEGTYIGMVRHNVDTIVKAINHES